MSWTMKFKYGGSATTHCRVNRVQPVGAHDDRYWQALRRKVVDATDQGVYAGAIFMVHLR